MFLIQSQHSHLPLELWDLSLPVATKCSLLKVSEYAIWRRKLVAHKCSSSFLPVVNICFYGIIQLFCGGNEFYSHTFNTEDHSMHIHWFRWSIKEVSRSCLNYLLFMKCIYTSIFFHIHADYNLADLTTERSQYQFCPESTGLGLLNFTSMLRVTIQNVWTLQMSWITPHFFMFCLQWARLSLIFTWFWAIVLQAFSLATFSLIFIHSSPFTWTFSEDFNDLFVFKTDLWK